MLSYWRQYRPILQFIFLFLGSYSILSLIYFWYLSSFIEPFGTPDGITKLVGLQTQEVMRAFGFEAHVAMISDGSGLGIWVDGKGVARLVEGCNAVSIMILFFSFVLAFAKGWQRTFGFMLAGLVLIYAINIIRLALISVAIAHFESYRMLLHDVIFPGLIYGFVLMLWIFWIWLIKRPAHA
ncbi:MAG: exosortase family protein XrtF [Flavobacteriaceae bacterium]|jgi:exosortase family protein XrtF|nr:exosortase family protein XrtF [Flavobacteriaceae bacterium]MDG1062882.1 exosortase family protein XrtF [Flavobacteriaceae bacterium]MDG1961676.1 exosortase family protein XrtF [Flavobacteriaceae bacterium]